MKQLFFGTDGSPLSKPEDVKRFLGKPKLHWKKGRSAYETAHSWFAAGGLPADMRRILETDPAFTGATLQKAFFERKTKLDALGRPSQTDVFAILQRNSEIIVLGVEAKVDEAFGPIVHEWNDESEGKSERLRGLCKRLRLNTNNTRLLRYQLIHRAVATILEAEQLGAIDAALVVQSFSPKQAGFSDFQKFAAALGTPVAAPGTLSSPVKLDKVRLRLGWIECSLHANGN